MCSISGFITQNPLDRSTARRLCTALIYYGAERGQQSAGVYVNGKIFKKACHPTDFIDSSDFFNLFTENPKYALCHTRQPTSGGLGDDQAQPFKVNNTVSIHNGFFFDTDSLKNNWKIKKKSGVDSELATRFIDSYGIQMLPNFLEDTEGPSAIAAIHKDKLYLMRSGNPTCFTRMTLDGGNQILIFASTKSILENSLKYCWLIPWNLKIGETKEFVLIHARPEGLSQQSKAIIPNKSWEIYNLVDSEWDIGNTGYMNPHTTKEKHETEWRKKNEVWREEREEILGIKKIRKEILKGAISALHNPENGERGQENAG